MKQGATGPYLCLADNNKKYVIKRERAGFEGCIKEWVLGRLGQTFGLPIPDCELVYVDRSLLEYNDTYESEIGEGIAFGSEHVPDLQEVYYQRLNDLPESKLRDLYVFDYWIRNADRNLSEQGGNPNLFYRHSNLDLIVLDHNLAFDRQFQLVEHNELHVCSQFWSAQIDYDLQQRYEERMEIALTHWDYVVTKIPEDWKEGVTDFDGFIEQIKLILNEYQSKQFWEGLK